MSVRKDHVRYLLDRRETFARAYAQWIVVKSKDPTLLSEFKQEHNLTRKGFKGLVYKETWAEKDFRPIAKALEGIFSELGWLR